MEIYYSAAFDDFFVDYGVTTLPWRFLGGGGHCHRFNQHVHSAVCSFHFVIAFLSLYHMDLGQDAVHTSYCCDPGR